jgi:hypothetical protein
MARLRRKANGQVRFPRTTPQARRLSQVYRDGLLIGPGGKQASTVFEPGTGPPLEAAGEYGWLFAELLNLWPPALLSCCPTDP